MKCTFPAHDYLAGIPELSYAIPTGNQLLTDIELVNNYKDLYIRPDAIIKSSVGDFYDQNMVFFLETVRLCMQVLLDKGSMRDICDMSNVLSHLMPLGGLQYTTEYPIEQYLAHIQNPAMRRVLNEGSIHVLDEVKTLVAGYGYSLKDYDSDIALKLEKVAHGLCAGYVPQKMNSVARVPNDSGYLSEAIMASIIYPWVMQPMTQLRLLMQTIDDDFRTAIAVKNPMVANLDAGYSITYDFLGDFSTYTAFRNVDSKHPCRFMRQFWTPFYGFSMPSVLTEIKDEKLKERIVECVARSKKLYVEMLKTGLRYQSQYAVLNGFIGRFSLSGNLAAILDYVYTLRAEDHTETVKDMVSEIEKDLKATVPFVAEAKLLD